MMAEFELARKPEKINAVWWMEWIKDGMRELRLNEWRASQLDETNAANFISFSILNFSNFINPIELKKFNSLISEDWLKWNWINENEMPQLVWIIITVC